MFCQDVENVSVRLTDGTEAQDHESTDQTSDCNAGEEQTPLKMCSIKLDDCRNLIESREEETTTEQQQQSDEEEQDNDWIDDDKEETKAQDSVWSVRDQRSGDTQDSRCSLTLLCYTDAQDHESTDQTSDCNAGEQQMLQTPLKMCSVKLVNCRNLIESREEETTTEQQQQSDEEEQDNDWIDDDKEETKAQDSVWSVRDQRSRDTQDSKCSLTLLCYTDTQDHESTDQTSDCNAGEQQTPLKMCSVKLVDCRNLIESREEETTAEQQQQSHEDSSVDEDDYENNDDDEDQNKDDDDVDDDDDFVPSGMFLPFMARCAKLTELKMNCTNIMYVQT